MLLRIVPELEVSTAGCSDGAHAMVRAEEPKPEQGQWTPESQAFVQRHIEGDWPWIVARKIVSLGAVSAPRARRLLTFDDN